MWRKKLIAAMLLVSLAGLALCFYPKISGARLDKEMQTATQTIAERILRAREEHAAQYDSAVTFDHGLSNEIPRFNEPLWNAMTAYNKDIWEHLQAGLSDPWAYEQPSFTLGDYGIEDEAFGVLIIPSLDLEMPLYLGASYANLAKGAAHLSQTSLPIGGSNTNCVIAGHRGWKGATFFRYLETIEIGAKVYVMNYWETLEYTVVETKVIDPNQVDELLIQPGKDMLTLFSCYQRSGKRRFVVYCERTS